MEFKSLLESASTNSQRRYKCMYCTKSYERAKLVNHIDKVHEDMIPEGYTAARLVFNMINKKDHGTCTICGKESPWNEEKGRYDRICINPECKKKYIKMTEERLQKARGVTKQQMLNDPEFQEKMLANRGISGKYKFQDGTYKTYTGTYEKKFLEFLDVFLHVNPADIYSPGPVIDYEYEGEKHKWITDFYYEPYNLVFDIKDGGDNPNNRSMVHYRAKQIEKEKAIKKLNKYNYIRLTDNNFEQLVLLMMELKELYLDNNKDMDHIIRINESDIIMGNTKEYDSYHDQSYLVEYKVNKDAILKHHGFQDFPYVIQEAQNGNKHPLFIVLSYTYTTFGKLTKAVTHADYSHAAISFDPSLHEMFSFNGDNKVNNSGGFSIEDIDEYTRFSDKSYMLINVVFVNDSQYESVKNYVNEYKKNIKNTRYSFANIFRILLNKPINDEGSNQMVCSEFVYSIFKYINQDFLNKSTNLVTPQDLADVKNKKIYKIYEGSITKYKEKNIEKKLKNLYNKAKVLGEQFLFEGYINEMSSKERNELPDSAFGIPSKRKYPLDTEAHVRSAIKFFNYCDKADEKELAENIIKAMKKFNITDIKVSNKNRFSKYYSSSVKEDNAATTVMVGTSTPMYSNNLMHMNFSSDNDDKKYAICKQYMTDLVLLDDDEVEPLEDFMEYATDIKMYKIEDPKAINESSINEYTEVYPYSNVLTDIKESVEATLLNEYNQLGIDSVPIFSLNENMSCTNVRYYRDLNGVFIKNIYTGFRSKSFEFEKEISESLVEYISKSII